MPSASVQAALSYPHERKNRPGSILIGSIELAPLLLYDAAVDEGAGGFVPEQSARHGSGHDPFFVFSLSSYLVYIQNYNHTDDLAVV